MTLKKLLKKRPECGRYQIIGITPGVLHNAVVNAKEHNGAKGQFFDFTSQAYAYAAFYAADFSEPVQVVYVSDEDKQITVLEILNDG